MCWIWKGRPGGRPFSLQVDALGLSDKVNCRAPLLAFGAGASLPNKRRLPMTKTQTVTELRLIQEAIRTGIEHLLHAQNYAGVEDILRGVERRMEPLIKEVAANDLRH